MLDKPDLLAYISSKQGQFWLNGSSEQIIHRVDPLLVQSGLRTLGS